MDGETYAVHKAMDWSEIRRGELLPYTDAIGSRVFQENSAQNGQNVFTKAEQKLMMAIAVYCTDIINWNDCSRYHFWGLSGELHGADSKAEEERS